MPSFGPPGFRLFVGLTFYPYSLMNASFVVLGSLLAPSVNFGRAGWLALAYLLAVGISAHALDAAAPNKPWGKFLTQNQLYLLAGVALVPALAIGLYLALAAAPLLLLVGSFELFFLFAYNLERFGSRFHNDLWFSISWGFLPVLAGFVVQTNSVTLLSLIGGLFGFLAAFIEISASRPYKALKRGGKVADKELTKKLERVLKGIVLTSLTAPALVYALRFLS